MDNYLAMPSPPPSPAERAPLPPELRRVIVVVVISSVLAMLDATVVNVALHALSTDLHAPLATIQWVITAYLLALAAATPASGYLARRFGAKRVFVLASALFTAASLLCAVATSAPEL